MNSALKFNEAISKIDNDENNFEEINSENKNNQFDPFQEFNSEIETYTNQKLDMRIVHKSRNALNIKKVACMDKILDDIKKRYEYETELNLQQDLEAKEVQGIDGNVYNDDNELSKKDHAKEDQQKDNVESEDFEIEHETATTSELEEMTDDVQKSIENNSKTDEEIETFKLPDKFSYVAPNNGQLNIKQNFSDQLETTVENENIF